MSHFDPVGQKHGVEGNVSFQIAHCVVPDCRAVVYVVWRAGKPSIHPGAPPAFNFAGVPDSVQDAIEEALQCRAHEMYRPAAVMLRRAVEVFCADQAASGSTLKEQILSLRGKMLLPSDLVESLDLFRFLGNDAVHVALKDFEQVGAVEVDAGIELLQALVHGVYGYRGTISRFDSLRTRAPK